MRATALITFALLAGTSASGQASRDSAGIQIITVKVPKAGGPVWKLSSSPTLEINSDADTTLLFNHVRHPRRTPSGLIAFAPSSFKAFSNARGHGWLETNSGRLALFDDHGRLVRVIGREGKGPKEFESVNDLLPLGDSILVFEGAWATDLKMVHRDGGFGESGYVDRTDLGSSIELIGKFSDGSVVIGTKVNYLNSQGDIFQATYARMDHTGKRLNKVAGPLLYDRVRRDWVRWYGRGTATVGNDLFYYAFGEKYEIAAYDRNGKLVRILRIDRELRPARKEDRAWLDAEQKRAEAIFRRDFTPDKTVVNIVYPDHLHAIDKVIADAAGNLWIREGSPSPTAPGTWLVIDRNGRFLATVRTPGYFEVSEIGSDYVLGVHAEEEGGSGVWMFRLSR
jgi:hypothetical protein